MNRPTANERAACRTGGQFREGHTNRHKRCLLKFPRGARKADNHRQRVLLCHQKDRERLSRQRR